MTTTTGYAPPTSAGLVGDGTTARSRARGRWRRLRAPLAVLAVLLVGGLVLMLPAPRTSTTPLAPDNAEPGGARALAQILQRHGVEVTYVRTIADAERAAAQAGSTLLVVGDYYLYDDMAARIAASPADLVLVDTTSMLPQLAPEVGTQYGTATQGETRTAACDDPDATAAGTVTASGSLVALAPGVVVCFPAEGAAGADAAAGAYAVVDQGGRRITVLADATPLTNAALPDEGNAALVIRALGRHPHLVWYLPSSNDLGLDAGAPSGPALTDLVPPVVPLLAVQALLVALAAAFWRGRRLGPVVTERLPVVVRAGETTRGRGRLYRRTRSYGHAAASLRAGTAARCAERAGLPRSAGPAAVVDAVARSTGRAPADVDALLYGPAPDDDRSLARLAAELDHLESEVHRT